MTTFGTIGTPANATSVFVEAADPAILQNLVNAALRSVDGTESVVTSLTLAGGGDGHPFSVLIESALSGDVQGGLVGTIAGELGTTVRCYLGSDPEALAASKSAAGIPAPVGPAPYSLIDEQLAGGAKGQRFMGMSVFESSAIPSGTNSPFALAIDSSTQSLGAGSTILVFAGLSNANQFDLPATQTVRYIGTNAIQALIEASVTVGVGAGGAFTVDIVSDPLGTPSVIATMKGQVAAGEFDNVSVLGFTVFEPPSVAPTLVGIRVTSAAGSVLYVSLRISRVG